MASRGAARARHRHEPEGADTLELRAEDGVRLALHGLGPPQGTPVVLVPGTFSNHTFWLGTRGTGFARALADAGYPAFALDPRGHGASQRPGPRDRWTFDDWARRDVPAAIRAVTSAERPGFLIGHSGGGAAALIALAAEPELRRRVSGVVVLATPLPWLQPLRRPLAHLVRGVSRVLGRFPARRLGLGPEDELPGIMAQWMTWNLDGAWRGDDGTDYVERLADVDVPLLALAGAGDRLQSPPAASRALAEMVGSADRTFEVCGRDTGYGEDFDHAGIVVSRAAREGVWPRVLAWLDERTPPRPTLPAS